MFALKRGDKPQDRVERINPEGVPKGILSLHKVRYEFAKRYSVGKSVLDVACGAGYGSAMLAEVAGHVFGVDLNKDAVNYALYSYQRNNLTYQAESAQALSFKDASFDTVVSFETIEHLTDIPRYLGEVCRVLKPHGTFIVSTPRARKTTKKPKNPHHTVEFSSEDFRALLKKSFSEVEMYGQIRIQGNLHYWLQKLDMLHLRHFVPVRLRSAIDRTLGTSPFEEMELRDQKVVKDDLRRAHDLIAVCSR